MASPREVQSVNNAELYDRWAKVYDTDGNILQAVDDALLPELLSVAFQLLGPSSPITVTELGCGTGRNTVKVLLPSNPQVRIKAMDALDLSPGMLDVAKTRCNTLLSENPRASPNHLRFEVFDALQPANFPIVRELKGKADLVLSTLVLEHLPLSTFFETAASFLKPTGGYFVLTNMHAVMGKISRAGFVDPESGTKIRGDSYAHEVPDVIAESEKWGFKIVGEMQEREVKEEDVGDGVATLLGPRGKKWIGVKVWFGCLMRYDGRS